MTNSLEKVRTLTARLAVTAISAIVLVFSTAWTSMADAAIPHSRTIISRLAKNSGRGVYVIDLFGLSEQEVRDRYPAIYQWVYDRVKPERDQNRRASYRERWWIHGEPRALLRPALKGLPEPPAATAALAGCRCRPAVPA